MMVLLADDAVQVFDCHAWSLTKVFSIILSNRAKQSLRNPQTLQYRLIKITYQYTAEDAGFVCMIKGTEVLSLVASV